MRELLRSGCSMGWCECMYPNTWQIGFMYCKCKQWLTVLVLATKNVQKDMLVSMMMAMNNLQQNKLLHFVVPRNRYVVSKVWYDCTVQCWQCVGCPWCHIFHKPFSGASQLASWTLYCTVFFGFSSTDIYISFPVSNFSQPSASYS
jgi:hypothetical protein